MLGIFGREGVGLANLWELNGDESYTYAAFRAYRNYDGAGADLRRRLAAGDVERRATATVYASAARADPIEGRSCRHQQVDDGQHRRHHGRLRAMFTKAQVYTITAGGGANVVAQADITTAAPTPSTTRCRRCRSR